MTKDEVIQAARDKVVDPAPAAIAANNNNAVGADMQNSAVPMTSMLTPEQHLKNAGIMYAKAAACFEGLYQQEVLSQAAGQQR